MLYLRRILLTREGLERIRSRSAAIPPQMRGSAFRRRAPASGAEESMKVPEESRNERDSRVRYAFLSTPQHMPLELLAMTPPIVQASMEAGSGPSLNPSGARRR